MSFLSKKSNFRKSAMNSFILDCLFMKKFSSKDELPLEINLVQFLRIILLFYLDQLKQHFILCFIKIKYLLFCIYLYIFLDHRCTVYIGYYVPSYRRKSHHKRHGHHHHHHHHHSKPSFNNGADSVHDISTPGNFFKMSIISKHT